LGGDAAVLEKMDEASKSFSAAVVAGLSIVVEVVSLVAQSNAPQYNKERDCGVGRALFFRMSSSMDFRDGMTKDEDELCE
jgi:hypothetical protein